MRKTFLFVLSLLICAVLCTAAVFAAEQTVYVKDGGTMVYSTCTIEQSENHYLVEEFLTQHPEWQRVEFTHPLTGEQVQELQLLPQNDGIDGFYICKLMKKQ